MWRVLNNLGTLVLQEIWNCNYSNSSVQSNSVGRNMEAKWALTKHLTTGQDLRNSRELGIIWDCPEGKKKSQMFQHFLPKQGQEKQSNQNKKVYLLLMLPSISGWLHLNGCHLKCCPPPRLREKEHGRACWLFDSLEKSTSTHILLPKHIPQPH